MTPPDKFICMSNEAGERLYELSDIDVQRLADYIAQASRTFEEKLKKQMEQADETM